MCKALYYVLKSISLRELSNEYLLFTCKTSALIQPRTSLPKFQVSFPPGKFCFISPPHRRTSVLYRDGSGGVNLYDPKQDAVTQIW